MKVVANLTSFNLIFFKVNEKDEQVLKQDWLLKQDLSNLDPSKLTPLTEEVWRVLDNFLKI